MPLIMKMILMKKLYLLISFLMFSLSSLWAQSRISVASFELLENDLTAITYGTEVKDQNGQTCALIKVETTETGFLFDFGIMSPMKVEQHVGEIWVYVPYGVKRVTIQHQQLGTLRNHPLDISVEKGKTYLMRLTTDRVETIIKETVMEQYLIFQITPPNAVLEVNDQVWPVSPDGTARKFVPFGTYNYRVQAPNYHSDVGKVNVNDPNNKQTVTVTLRSNVGWIEVSDKGNLKDATVYVDNTLIGKTPCKSEALKSGPHNVKIVKEMYAPYNATVTVSDDETTHVAPELSADFAHVTLQVDGDAEIWVNEEQKGVRTWTGDLASGTYRMECRQKGHEPSSVAKEITHELDGQTIELPAPSPIYGSLNVESTPDFAKLYIDGKLIGETPCSIAEILIGEHSLRLCKEGFACITEAVTIAKGERQQVHLSMVNNQVITVNGVSFKMNFIEGGSFAMGAQDSDPSGANYDPAAVDESPVHNVTLDGFYIGETAVTQALWKAVMGDNPSRFKGDSLPVETVNWDDCQLFISKLNQLTGKNFRLPTEAEWEFAARGGTKTSLYSGENIDIKGQNNAPNLDGLAWYGGNCGRDYTTEAGCDVAKGVDISSWAKKQYDDLKGGTHPVGKKQPNAYGLYDMLGNVWEWCQDWYSHYSSNAQTNPKGLSSGTRRVMRGGSWGGSASHCRVSSRLSGAPDRKGNGCGLRLVLPQ